MAIFSELAQRANRTREDLIQKTQDFSDINRLTHILSDEKNNKEMLLRQIGEKYVQLHREDFEPDFADAMQQLFAVEQSVLDYQKQIQEIKGIIICKGCGADILKNAAFCQSCGKPVPKEDKEELAGAVKCWKCRAIVDESMNFCMKCGTPVQRPEEKMLCRNCGAALEETMHFCMRCGTPVPQDLSNSIEEEVLLISEEPMTDSLQKSE